MRYRFKKNRTIWMLILIMIIQMLMMIYWGTKKEGFHIDEILAFQSANSTQSAFMHWDKDYLGNWHDKIDGYLWDYITVQENEAFSYNTVYSNIKQDNHPPLYFFILHTVSSFFENNFSKWMIIIPNIIVTLLSVVILYMLGKNVLHDKFLAIMVAAAWGGSAGTMSMAVFGRMYALFTFFTILFVFMNVLFMKLQKNDSFKICCFLLLATIAGIMTHYYFLIICLFLCGSVFFYLLINKKWKKMCQYCAIEILGLIISIIILPHMIERIFFQDRGKQAVKTLSEFSQLIERIGVNLAKTKEIWVPAIIVSCIVIILFILKKLKYKSDDFCNSKRNEFLKDYETDLCVNIDESVTSVILCVTGFGYFVLISLIAPYQTYRYFACITPIVFLWICFMLRKMWSVLLVHKIGFHLVYGIIVFISLIIFFPSNQEYLSVGDANRMEIVQKYRDYPAIGIYERVWCSELEVLRFAEHKSLLVLQNNDMQILDDYDKKSRITENSVVLYVDKKLDIDIVFKELYKILPFTTFQKLFDDAYSDVYYLEQ